MRLIYGLFFVLSMYASASFANEKPIPSMNTHSFCQQQDIIVEQWLTDLGSLFDLSASRQNQEQEDQAHDSQLIHIKAAIDSWFLTQTHAQSAPLNQRLRLDFKLNMHLNNEGKVAGELLIGDKVWPLFGQLKCQEHPVYGQGVMGQSVQLHLTNRLDLVQNTTRFDRDLLTLNWVQGKHMQLRVHGNAFIAPMLPEAMGQQTTGPTDLLFGDKSILWIHQKLTNKTIPDTPSFYLTGVQRSKKIEYWGQAIKMDRAKVNGSTVD